MVDTQPLVSVIMPTRDGRLYIASAIASLQSQDYPDLEIIVIDDASTDDTAKIVEALASTDPRIILIRAHHRSIAAARNEALRCARGAFISFLDHDDLCAPGKISRQLIRLAQNPKATAIFGQTVIFSSVETIAATVLAKQHTPALTMLLSSALFRRDTFDRIGFLDPRYKLADDFDLILRLCETDQNILIEVEVATLHRRHPAQATADLDATRRETILALGASLRRRREAGRQGHLRLPLLATVLS